MQYTNDRKGFLVPYGLRVDTTNATRLRETVTSGDWDGDGDIDLAFANSNLKGPFTTAPDVWIYVNDGKGNFKFSKSVALNFNRFVSKLETVDLDRDGDLDLLGLADGLFYVIANGSFFTGVSNPKIDRIPGRFSLRTAHPNPFAKETHAELILSGRERQEIAATIFDLTGRTVKTWQIDTKQNTFELVWDGRDQQNRLVPNGLYFLNIRVGNSSISQKLMVLR